MHSSSARYEQQLTYLEQKIAKDIAKLRKQSNSFKRRAFQLNLAILCLGGLVTVLLGVDIANGSMSPVNSVFKNLALISGVLITVLSGIERFSDNRSLWIKQRGTLLCLYTLQSEIEFYKAGFDSKDGAAGNLIGSLFNQYQEIWKSSAEEWQTIRKKLIASSSGYPTLPAQQLSDGVKPLT